MNWGGFAGGFSQGMESGFRNGERLNKLISQHNVRNLIQQGLAEKESADKASEAAGASKVEEGPATEGQAYKSETGATVTPVKTSVVEAQGLPPIGAPNVSTQTPGASVGASADGNAGEAEAQAAQAAPAAAPVVQATPQSVAAAGGVQPGQFYDGDKKFATRAEAEKSATGKVMSKDEYLAKNIYPKVRDYYIEQGDTESAEHWDKYAKSKRGEAINNTWAKVVTAPDLETATKHARDLYEYIDDGITTTGQKIVTKADGTQIAVVTIKDKTTGKTSEMELTQDKVMQFAGSANPQKMYEDYKSQQAAAAKMKAEAHMKREDRTYTRETELLKQEASDKREASRLAAQAEREAVREDRRDARELTRGDQREREIILRDTLRDQIGADGASRYAKTTDPKERAAILDKHYSENDTAYRKMDKPAQEKFIQDKIESYDRVGNNVEATRAKARGEGTAPADKPSAAIETKPMPYKEGAPVKYNKQDGKPYHLIDGKYIPIEGGVIPKKPAAGPAAGMPKGNVGSW